MSRVPTPRPARDPSPAERRRQEHRQALHSMDQAIRAIAGKPGWLYLKAQLVQELMTTVQNADEKDITALTVAMGRAKGIVSTIRTYESHETPGLDTPTTKPPQSGPGGT